jgi:hypothetical protein
MRMLSARGKRKRRWIIATVVLALVGAVAWPVYDILYTLAGLQDAYAKWDAATLVIEFMDTHDGRWPRGWEDLRGTYSELQQRTGHRYMHTALTFDEFRSRVGIDFQADPAKLAMMPENREDAPFRVIWAASGNTTTWSGAEPNQIVLEYLRGVQDRREILDRGGGTTKPATRNETRLF